MLRDGPALAIPARDGETSPVTRLPEDRRTAPQPDSGYQPERPDAERPDAAASRPPYVGREHGTRRRVPVAGYQGAIVAGP